MVTSRDVLASDTDESASSSGKLQLKAAALRWKASLSYIQDSGQVRLSGGKEVGGSQAKSSNQLAVPFHP